MELIYAILKCLKCGNKIINGRGCNCGRKFVDEN